MAEAVATPAPRLGPWRGLLWLALTALVLAGLGPLLAADPLATDLRDRLAPPSWAHPLGTDHLGRDLLARIVHGARLSLGLSFVIATCAAAIGGAVGLLAGVAGRVADAALTRVTEIFLSFPELIAAVAIAGALGPSVKTMAVALIATGWMRHARVARAIVMEVRERDYVTQARLFGVEPATLLWRHFAPAVAPSLVVLWTTGWARAILAVSGLGFLGFGAQPPEPEWGAMLLYARSRLMTDPLLMLWPGLAVALSVLAITLSGDALRDAIGLDERRAA